jgi:hypothetical protein
MAACALTLACTSQGDAEPGGDEGVEAAAPDATDASEAGETTGEVDANDAIEATDATDTAPEARAPRVGPPQPGTVPVPAIEGPITGGDGRIVLGPPGFDLAKVGYVEEEYFVSGTATSYKSDEALTTDGLWTVRADATAAYKTRIVVRRPADKAGFDGTVLVEWLNVSGGMDIGPDWTLLHDQAVRAGWAWVGVSAQKAGIEGTGDAVTGLLVPKVADPVRYGSLSHPGDEYSYDMFSQAGAAVWFAAGKVMGGMEPASVVAIGESQSAFRLTTYIDAVAPVADVYDGYLVHSRAASGAKLATGVAMPFPTLSRTDLEVPVLVLSTETDMVEGHMDYGDARQPDGPWFAGWEVAGTAHMDAYGLGIGDLDDGSAAADRELFQAMLSPPTSVYFGIMQCEQPINTGPHTYVVRSAAAALVTWARAGTPPPSMPRLEIEPSGLDLVRDAAGIAVGGIRTPHVDAPIATLSGLGQAGGSFCFLFGTTRPFTADELAARYPDHAKFVDAWGGALDSAVAAGAILPADAERLLSAAQESAIGVDTL